MSTAFSKIRIVLVNTSHPGNIGAAARAMKTMGLTRLYLVAPKIFPDAQATAMASGADDILHQAIVCNSLDEALADCVLAVATSARLRQIEWPQLTPPQAAQRLLTLGRVHEVALVFGRESAGLDNTELDRCRCLVNIPANPAYQSLNLAAAVQILCYELHTQDLQRMSGQTAVAEITEPLANRLQFEGFFTHLQETLVLIRFLNPSHNKSLLRRLRRLFSRTELTVNEINILRGILQAIHQAVEQASADNNKV